MSSNRSDTQTLVLDKVIVICLLAASALLFTDTAVDKTLGIRVLAVLSTLLLGFLLRIERIRSYLRSGIDLLDVGLLAFCLWQLLSATWACNTAEALAVGFRGVAMFGSYLLVKILLSSSKSLRGQFPFIVSLVAGVYLLLTWYELLHLKQQLGLNAQSIYALRYPSYTKNLVSIYMLVGSFFSIHALLNSVGLKRFLTAGNLIGVAATLIFFSTRSISLALVAVGSVLVLIQLLSSRHRFKKGIMVGITVLVFGVAHWFMSSAIRASASEHYKKPDITAQDPKAESTESAYRSANERLVLWKKTAKLILKNPVLGVGAGNWQIVFPSVGLDGLERAEYRVTSFKRPHNEALWILSETGVIGFLLFTFVLITFFVRVFKGSTSELVFGLGMLALLITAMFDFPRERMEHSVLFAMLMAGLGPQRTSFRLSSINSSIAMGILVCFVATGIWVQYNRVVSERQYIEMRILKDRKEYEKALAVSKNLEHFCFTLDWLSYPMAWYNGMFHTYMGNFAEGEEEFHRALELNPWNFHTHNNLGFCLASQGKFEEAIPCFENALNINNKFEDARFNLSYSLFKSGRQEEAIEVLNHHIRDSTKLKLYLDQLKYANGDN